MIVRVAEKRDFSKVHKLFYEVFEKHLSGRPDIYKEGDPYKLEQFMKTLENKNEVILLAIEENEVIGLSHMLRKEFRGEEVVQDGVIASVEDFVINKEYRRKGFGKKLYEKSIEQARFWNADSIELNVWNFNEEAKAFYYSVGLKVKNMRMECKII